MVASFKTKTVFALLGLVYLSCFIGFNQNIDPAKGGKPIIHSDGRGMYDYLPRLFLHHHLEYTAQDHQFASADEAGRYINRFFCGTAILELPFFAGGVLYARAAGYPVDGYSPPFQYAVGTAAVVYSLWGFYLLFVLLVRYMHCSRTNALWTVALTAIGTNIIFYSTWFGSFSHAFSFFAVTAFLYRTAAASERPGALNFFAAGLLFGLVALIRPVNVLVIVLVPVLFGGKEPFFAFVKKVFRPRISAVILAAVMIIVFIQCWVWYMQTGGWVRWSYRQEGFYFSHPRIAEVLFGFRRGLFVYCPLLLLALTGITAGMKLNKWVTAWLVVFLLLYTYVISSWWHWTYGDTFGMRPFNDVLPAFMILFAFSLTYFVRARKFILFAAVLLSALNLVFAWQYATGITNLSTMTADKYFALFLKTSPAYRQLYGGSDDLPPYAPNGFRTLHVYNSDFSDRPGGSLQVRGEEFVGSSQFLYPGSERYNRHIWINLRYKRKLVRPTGMKEVLLVFHAIDTHRDTTRTYEAIRVKEYPVEKTGEWETVHQRVWLPDAVNANNLVKIYLWNRGKETFDLDDYHLTVQVPVW